MNRLLERIDALEEVSREQQRQIDELNLDKRNQQRQIDELESRIDALEGEAKKRQITVANVSTKRIKISTGIKGDLYALDINIINYIVSHLPPADLVNVGRTCGRFGLILGGQQRSLANEAARQIFASAASEYESSALPLYDDESEIAWLRQLYFLREPLEFRQLIGKDIFYTSTESRSKVSMIDDGCSSAMSNFAMRRGKHCATFNVSREGAGGFFINVGIVRPLPGWDEKELDVFDPAIVNSSGNVSQDLIAERTERWGTSDVNCCSYWCYDGRCYWSDWSDRGDARWEGAESLDEAGTIGLLLDLDEGTLTVYKNGRRLGVMKSGLSGEYCWYTSMFTRGGTVVSLYDEDYTVSIERDTLS